MVCKTAKEKAAAEAEAQRIADMEEELERLRDEADRRKREEDDTTDIRMAPISIPNDQSTVKLIGLFFNQPSIREEDEPESGLVIEKDVLDRSSGMIFGRFQYETDARAKLVFNVSLDGKELVQQGTGLPYGKFKGIYDVGLFKYPNSARANKDGIHWLKVEYGLITGIAEQALGLLDWGNLTSESVADFTIKLLPHKEPQD